jgi:hypothetical protein
MKPSQPLASLLKRWNDIRRQGEGLGRGQRRKRHASAATQPGMFRFVTESLESRLLLTVTAPASAMTIQNDPIYFSQTGQGAISVTEPAPEAGQPLQLTLVVNNGVLSFSNTTGLGFMEGPNGTRALSVVGTPANLNTDLNSLAYTPNAGYTGDDSLDIFAGNNAGEAIVPLYVNAWTNSTASSLASEKKAAGSAGIDVSLLLPNGDLMVHQSGGQSKIWYEITPDSEGSYADGTWKKLASMHQARLYFSSDVLPDGDVFVFGGEYASDGQISFNSSGQVVPKGTPGSIRQYSDSGEIYDPATNVWTTIATGGAVNYPAGTLTGQKVALNMAGDQPSEVLPDGDVLVGNIFNNGTEIYVPELNANGTPAKGTWITGPTRQYPGEFSDEESWVKLGNGDILNYDIYASENDQNDVGQAELYVPSTTGGTGQWVTANDGDLPLLTTSFTGNEIGPALLDPSTGDAVFFGANGLTAIYNPTANSWAQGPTLPSVYFRNPVGHLVLTQLTMGDAPGAVLPNGDFLLALSPATTAIGPGQTFPSPTYLYEWNPQTNVFVNVTPSFSVTQQYDINSFADSMLVLPTGQALLTNTSSQLAFYALAPGDGPAFNWLPTITGFTFNKPPLGSPLSNNGSYTLTGTQLNGPDEGAAYGDDEQMAENYPIVEFSDGPVFGSVYYATTSYWSSTGVATGNTPQSVTVVLPTTIPSGTYSMFVIADGISSLPFTVVLGTYTKQPTPVSNGAVSNVPVSNAAVSNVTNAAQFSGVAASAGPGSDASPLQAPVALTSSVTPPTSSLDLSWNKSTLPTRLQTQEKAAAFEPVQFGAALGNSEINQWAGLQAALDILSA